jgi:hypothetical protein
MSFGRGAICHWATGHFSYAIFLCLSLSACGREGPPLPPFIRIPEAVKDLAVTQSGHDLVLTWTNPAKNIDGSAATNLAHAQIRSDGATVASLNVTGPGQPQSYAIALGSNPGGRRTFALLVDTTEGKTSQLSNAVSVAAVEVPGAVRQLNAVVDQRRITLQWERPQEHPEFADTYVVVRIDAPAEPQTVSETRYEDNQYQQGKVLTYQVTAARRVDGNTVPGAGSQSVTITVEDKTPPQVPSGLDIVQSDTGGFLTWAPNAETDLAGYRLFRSDRQDGQFRPVSDRLIATNSYFDPTYKQGQYYRVSAVDEFGNESRMSAPFHAP